MSMARAHLERNAAQDARLVPIEPQVKSSETRELFNSGVSELGRSAKSADPTCYNSLTVELTGLFEKMETTMKLTNEQCREQALIQFKLGNYVNALRWYNTAAARTIGHKKAEAYEAMAKECAKLAGAAYDRCYFAEDYEAVQAA